MVYLTVFGAFVTKDAPLTLFVVPNSLAPSKIQLSRRSTDGVNDDLKVMSLVSSTQESPEVLLESSLSPWSVDATLLNASPR